MVKTKMHNCIILGKPNAGKTTFFLNFAEYLGVSKCTIEVNCIHGRKMMKTYTISLAKKFLISSEPFKTREICKLRLTIPIYKGSTEFLLLDTGGITDGINADENIRRSMSETLKQLQKSNIILHVIDASCVFSNKINGLSEIDYQVNQYARSRGAYCILANKMDQPDSLKGLEFIQGEFKDTYVIGISAHNKMGFKEVKMFVARNI
jgi:small GTP-binding protein